MPRRRRVLALIVPLTLILLAAAAPEGPNPSSPTPAAAPPPYAPAPLPRDEIALPDDPSPDQPAVRPHLFSVADTGRFRGDGYVPGSTVASLEEERWTRPEPGVTLTVPLQ